ncbi:MAG: hypothetical protein KA341_11510 [Saprospiraceae bacterium]|jgi:hypothetical protein|nr:hypothetical protein [Saprospiraceae bacterium]
MNFETSISKKETLFAFIIIGIFIGFAYQRVLKVPNDFLVNGGDGMKNYFTYLYHVKHDSTYMTFEGMNYPFGENVIFTDNQPLIANLTKLLSTIFPVWFECNVVAFHNVMLIFGVILGGLGLFLCFRSLKIDFLFALVCTLGLILLNPQAGRINGHFSMFYPVLPWIFYLWVLIWEGKNKLKLSVFIGLIVFGSGLLHMYYFVTISVLTLLSVFIFYAFQPDRNWIEIFKVVGLQIILPFLLLNYFSSYFNHCNDRPNEPWGFFSYHSAWEGLLFSYKLPLFEFINENIVQVRSVEMEGKNYIGFIAVIFVIFGIFYTILRFTKSKNFFSQDKILIYFIGVFVISSLMSFGLPFTISGLEWMLDYTGPYKQFRSIGRVGWVSFYAINLAAIYFTYHWLKSNKSRAEFLYTIPLIILVEGVMFFNKQSWYQTHMPDFLCESSYNLPINADDFQATLPDPYFNTGSECFSWWEQGEVVTQSYKIGYNMALPSMGVMMSRTSFGQSLLLNELTNQPFKVPKIIDIIRAKSKKPLLVIETKKEIQDYRPKLTHWTKKAPIIFENDDFRLRRMELDMFDQVVKEYNDSISKLVAHPFVSFTLKFSKNKNEKGWGYEAICSSDTLNPGNYIISYFLECNDATYLLSTTDAWQFDINHNAIDFINEGNRYNYKRIEGNKILIETPINIKPNATKVLIRVTKFNQKEKHNLNIENAHIRSTF